MSYKQIKIRYKHNCEHAWKSPNQGLFDNVQEFEVFMSIQQEKFYPQLSWEIISTEEVTVDPYESAYREDMRYRRN